MQKCQLDIFWKVCSDKFRKYFAGPEGTTLLYSDFNKKMNLEDKDNFTEDVFNSFPWLSRQEMQQLTEVSDLTKRKSTFEQLLQKEREPLAWAGNVFCQQHDRCKPLDVTEKSCGSNDSLKRLMEHHNCVITETIAAKDLAKSVDIKKALENNEVQGDRPTSEELKSGNMAVATFCKEDFSLGGIASAGLGAVASFATHELAHEVTGRVMGTPLDWNSKDATWSCPHPCPNVKPVAIAGLLSHNVASEVIVQKNDQNSMFQKGWLIFNVANTGTYFLRDWYNKSKGVSGYKDGGVAKPGSEGYGDLRAFSKNQSLLIGTALTGHQLYSAYRYYQNGKNRECKPTPGEK